MTDANGNVTNYAYDSLDNIETITQPAVLVGGGSTHPVTHYTHDNLGELLSVEDPNEALTSYSYNGLGQQVSMTAPDPTTLDGTGGPVTTYTFDVLGGVLNTVAPQPSSSTTVNTTTTDAYDGFHRLASVTDASGTTYYGYSDAGDQTSETDPDGNVTHWSYDDLHEQTGMTDPLGNSASYNYNLAGDLTSTVDRNGHEIDYGYDNLGRGTTETWVGGGAGGSNYVIDTSYNDQGDVASASDSAVTYTYTTDHLGELTSVDDAYASATNVPDVTLNMGYDANGNRTSLDAVVGGNYDFQDSFTPDALNRTIEIQQAASTATGSGVVDNAVAQKEIDLSYLANGQFDTISRNVFSGSTKELVAKGTYGYDDAERLTSISYSQPSSTLPTFSWTYDGANQVHSFTSSEDGTATYGYDPTGQLMSAAYTALSGHTYYADNSSIANESNSFDANGNSNASGVSLNTTGVSTGGNQVATDGTWNYHYDNNGNLTSQVLVTTSSDPNAVNEIDYTYDFRNDLTEVEKKNSSGNDLAVLDYVYDMYDELIGRTATVKTYNSGTGALASTTTTTQKFVNDPLNNGEPVLGFDGTGKITDRYLYGPAVDQILADETYSSPSAAPTSAGTTFVPLTDNEGSVRDVEQYNFTTNAADNVEHIVYNSFGAKLSDTGSVTFAFGFQDEYTDSVSADQLHGVRWFDPATQRWLTQDPAGLTFGTNPYVADGNSPTNFTDPSGLCPWWVPKWLCPQSALPTMPLGTATDASRQEAVLANLQWQKGRAEYIRTNGPNTIFAAGEFPATGQYWSDVGSGLKGYFWNGPKNIAAGLWHAAMNLPDTVAGLANAAWHPINTFNAVAAKLEAMAQTPEGQGEIGFNIALMVLTAGGAQATQLNAVTDAGRAADAVNAARAAEIAQLTGTSAEGANAARIAASANATSRVAELEEAAGEARQCTSEITCFPAGTPVMVRSANVRPRASHFSATKPQGESGFGRALAFAALAASLAPTALYKKRRRKQAKASTEQAVGFLDAERPDEELQLAAGAENASAATAAVDGAARGLAKNRASGLAVGRCQSRASRRVLASAWIAACLAIATIIGFSATSKPVARPTMAAIASSGPMRTAPIETIQVGQRVVTSVGSTLANKPQGTAVDQRTWRLLRLEAKNRWPDGTLDSVEVEALEPPEWLATHESAPGTTIRLPLDLEEIGLPLAMNCRVLANEPCPPIEQGPGRVILATVNHLNADVRELDVVDAAGRRETIRPTGLHKFYSSTRAGWVSAKDLRIGEQLQGAEGPVFVRALRSLPGSQRVYNMRVEDEHVYRVSALGVLVHNPGCGPGNWQTVNEAMSERAAAYQAQITGQGGQAYVVNGVKFDGVNAQSLLEAKGPGYANFVENGQFRPWFEGRQALIDQANAQVAAANGTPIVWNVAEAEAATAMQNLFNGNGITGITIVVTPPVP